MENFMRYIDALNAGANVGLKYKGVQMNEDRIADICIIGVIITIIVLKLTNVIKISWLWLLSPIWILFGTGIILAIFITIACLIKTQLIDKKEKENERC